MQQAKLKLEQKKNKLAAEETKLKLKERKARIRRLIEVGGLVTKAGLDHLPTNAIYGALLHLKKKLAENENLVASWIVAGNTAFNKEQAQTTAVIIKFDEEPDADTKTYIRSHNLRWNSIRQEWYGHVSSLDVLKMSLGDKINYNLEIIE